MNKSCCSNDSIWKIQLVTQTNGTPVGILDGVAADGNGHYYASDFVTGKIFLIELSGKATMLLELKTGSADIEYIQDKKLLLSLWSWMDNS